MLLALMTGCATIPWKETALTIVDALLAVRPVIAQPRQCEGDASSDAE